MSKNKYTYYKVIQEYWNGWHDSDFHECSSDYIPKDYKLYRENLKAYRENSGTAIRVIKRRELNEVEAMA